MLFQGNYVLCGERDTGKTTSIYHSLEIFPGKIGGWLSPGIFSKDGEKIGYDLLLVDQSTILNRLPLVRQKPFSESYTYKDFFFQNTPMKKRRNFSFV